MKKIKLTGKLGGYTLVDDEDFVEVSQYKWYQNYQGYAVRGLYENRKRIAIIRLHRVLLSPPPKLFIDHINRNKLDNRRSNLRICTHAENMINSVRSLYRNKPQTSKYRGIYYDSHSKRKKRWVAELKHNNIRYRLGNYLTEKEAVEAYKKQAIKLYGQFALSH